MKNILRTIDANCNRIGEGLRFLEDIARFNLNDVILSRQLKQMRHTIIKIVYKLGFKLVSQRNSETDVGAAIESMSQVQDLPSLIMANAKRAEEGLRVIEELAKLPEISPMLNYIDFQKARFDLYTVEQQLLSLVLRKQKIGSLNGLYLILDTQTLKAKDEVDAAARAIRGGAKILQLRDKRLEKGKLFALASKLKNLCHQMGTLFIVNDHLDIALAVDADGVHLGQEDLPITEARNILAIDKIIGCSVTNLRQAHQAERGGADYIAVGAIYPTLTKEYAPVVGLKCLYQIKQKTSVPVIAIGGINKDNITEVFAAGADAVAMVSAVFNQEDVTEATRQMVRKIAKTNKGDTKTRSNR